MPVSRRAVLSCAAALGVVAEDSTASRPTIRLGVLTDLAGSYRDNTGPNSVACTHQARCATSIR
jgi:branched-chain amino acid transport system substrate-binding protein